MVLFSMWKQHQLQWHKVGPCEPADHARARQHLHARSHARMSTRSNAHALPRAAGLQPLPTELADTTVVPSGWLACSCPADSADFAGKTPQKPSGAVHPLLSITRRELLISICMLPGGRGLFPCPSGLGSRLCGRLARRKARSPSCPSRSAQHRLARQKSRATSRQALLRRISARHPRLDEPQTQTDGRPELQEA